MAVRVVALILLFCLVLAIGSATGQQPAWDIEGEYEIKLDYQKNFALDRRNRDDLFRFDQEFQLRWSYRPKDWISVLLEGKLLGEHQLYTGGGGRRSEFDPERGETWIRFDNLLGQDLTLKLGRQNFEEPRRWWWDDDLDAAGLRYRHGSGVFEFGFGRELPRKSLREKFSDPEHEGVFRVLARANWLYLNNHGLDLFSLYHDDRSRTPSVGAFVSPDSEDPSDARLWWGGIRASGSETGAYGEFSYWADAAIVLGNEKLLELAGAPGNPQVVTSRRKQRVRGWAFDSGLRWDSPLPAEPLFTLGYAVGSGDKTQESGSDRAFRQTGLESNDEEFRTYGEILRPELSNLSIPVVAVPLPILSNTYVEFAYRHFRQIHAAPFVRGEARIEAEPNGIKKNIGQEWMLYSLIKEWKKIEIELVGAAFRAGNAYGALSGKMAYSLFTKITFEF
jgi:hypothetical protein